MPFRIVIEADRPEELDYALRRLAGEQGGRRVPTLPQTPEEQASQWDRWLSRRSVNQQRVIAVMLKHNGRVLLSTVKAEAELNTMQIAGVLGTIQRASKAEFGEALIQPQPWFQNAAGTWDREYVLNASIIPTS